VSHPSKATSANLVVGTLLGRFYRRVLRPRRWSPDGFRPGEGYASLDTDARYHVRHQAERLAAVIRWKMADLYLAEAALLIRQEYPTAASLTFDAQTQLYGGYAVTIRAIHDASRQRLDHPERGNEDLADDSADESLLRDMISYAVEWDNDYAGTGREFDFDRVLAGELR
jgi:hypothetical protein